MPAAPPGRRAVHKRLHGGAIQPCAEGHQVMADTCKMAIEKDMHSVQVLPGCFMLLLDIQLSATYG